jgi:hypothetical protein
MCTIGNHCQMKSSWHQIVCYPVFCTYFVYSADTVNRKECCVIIRAWIFMTCHIFYLTSFSMPEVMLTCF